MTPPHPTLVSSRTISLIGILVVAVTALHLGVLQLSADDRALDRFKYMDSRYNYGRGESDATDAGTLSWSEAYFLESYIDLYTAYQDTYWLDKIVDHFDRVKASASNFASFGDPVAGVTPKAWLSPRYTFQNMTNPSFDRDAPSGGADELITNGTFETAGGGGSVVPSGWTRVSGSDSTVYRTTTSGQYLSGSAGLAVKYYSGDAYVKQTFTYTPGRWYIVRYAAKGGNSNRRATGRIDIWDENASAVWANASTELVQYDEGCIFSDQWMKGSFVFQAPSQQPGDKPISVRLKLWHDTHSSEHSDWEIYYDDISIKPVENIVNTLENSTLEVADGGDSSLPDKWTRGAGTSTHVYRSNAAGEFHSGSYASVIKSDGSTWMNLYQRSPFVPGNSYSVSYWAKTNGTGSATGEVLAYNATTASVIQQSPAFTSTTWTLYGFTFTAPSNSGHELRIMLRQTSAGNSSAILYVDDIVVEPVVDKININHEFNDANGGDSTLPLHWTRSGSTSSSNAKLTTALNEYYIWEKGLAILCDDTFKPEITTPLYFTPGMKYTASFVARTNSPASSAVVDVYKSSGSPAVLASTTISGTDWSQGYLSFTAPSSLTDTVVLRIRHDVQATDGTLAAYFDSVAVTPAENRSADLWWSVNKTSSTAYVSQYMGTSLSTRDSLDGKGLVIGNDGSTDGYVYQRIRGYKESRPHSVWFYGKTSTSANGYKVVVFDVTANTELASEIFTNLEFAQQRVNFTTPSNPANEIEIRLTQQYYNNSSQYAYFDRVKVGERAPFLVNEAQVIKPILKFIKAVKSDSSLTSGYGSKATEYLDFIEDYLLPKWEQFFTDNGDNGSIPSDAGLYVFPAGNSGGPFPGRVHPHNQYIVSAESFLYLWDIALILGRSGSSSTPEAPAYYLDHANKLFNNFKDGLTTNGNGYHWYYMEDVAGINAGMAYEPGPEDSSHGCLDISAVVSAYHHYTTGSFTVFDATDMAKFTATFIENMWNENYATPVIGGEVNQDLSSPAVVQTNFLLKTRWLPDWVKLREFDSEMWYILEATIENEQNRLLNLLPNSLAFQAVHNPEIIFNGDFEFRDSSYFDSPSSLLPARWTRNGSTSSTAFWNDADGGGSDKVYAGVASATLITNGSSENILQNPFDNYVPNSTYELKFKAKAATGDIQAKAIVYDYDATGTGGDVNLLGTTNVSSTSWATGSFSFTSSPAADRDVRVLLYHNTYTPASKEVYFDDVKIYPGLWNSFAPNGSFELSDWFDSTLPRYWTRSGANVVLETSVIYKGAKSIKLTTSPSTPQQLVYELRGYVPGASYTLTFYAKTNGSSAKAKGRVRNVTTSSNLATSSLVDTTSWTNFTVGFTAPSTYTDVVEIYLEHNDPSVASGIAYFDEVGVTKN